MATKFSVGVAIGAAAAAAFLALAGCANNDSPGGTLPGDRPTRIATEAGESAADGQPAPGDAAVDRFDSSVVDTGIDSAGDGSDF